MTTFEQQWQRTIDANPDFGNPENRMTINVAEFRRVCRSYFDKGKESGVEAEQNSQSLWEQVFGRKA